METATDEPCRSRHWLQMVVLAGLLIAGLLGMDALVGGPAAAIASMTSPAHAAQQSPDMTGVTTTASMSTASGAHGAAHGSGGCADAMCVGGGSTCVSVPTGKNVPAMPAPAAASLPELVPAAVPTPPSGTPRRLALTHLELSIYLT